MFLTSPNNPDGSLMSDDDILSILELPVLVVLDEAYIEFSGVASKMPWVQRYPNLVVLRTFSKSAALAGLRVGYGAFPLDMVEYIWRCGARACVCVWNAQRGRARGLFERTRECVGTSREWAVKFGSRKKGRCGGSWRKEGRAST